MVVTMVKLLRADCRWRLLVNWSKRFAFCGSLPTWRVAFDVRQK